jgi:translation initiation factor IF-3
MAHQEFGHRLIERVKNDLESHAVVEQYPKMEGRQLIMVLAPKKAVVPAKPAPRPATKAAPKAAPKAAAQVAPEEAPREKPDAVAS